MTHVPYEVQAALSNAQHQIQKYPSEYSIKLHSDYEFDLKGGRFQLDESGEG